MTACSDYNRRSILLADSDKRRKPGVFRLPDSELSEHRCRFQRRVTRSSAWCCSTTGRRATSRPGNTSRSAPSCRRTLRPRSPLGSSRSKHWPLTAWHSPGRKATRSPWPIWTPKPTARKVLSTSSSLMSSSVVASVSGAVSPTWLKIMEYK